MYVRTSMCEMNLVTTEYMVTALLIMTSYVKLKISKQKILCVVFVDNPSVTKLILP